jgi:hypothetical protein
LKADFSTRQVNANVSRGSRHLCHEWGPRAVADEASARRNNRAKRLHWTPGIGILWVSWHAVSAPSGASNKEKGSTMGKCIGAIMIALVVLGVAAAQASAVELPNVTLLEGEKFPLTVTAEATTGVQLETAAGGKAVVCTARRNHLEWTEPTPLGSYIVTWTGCKDGALACKTVGDPAETLLLSGEFHFVPRPGGGNDIAYLTPAAYMIGCGGKEKPEELKIKVEGAFLEAYNGQTGKDITSFDSALKGSKGKQELKKYLNDKGEEVEVGVKVNLGLGFEAADINVEKELEDKASESKMFLVA